MGVTRRTFLETVGIGAGAVVLHRLVGANRPAHTGERRFVFAQLAGGWDTLMSLDPRDPETFTEARVGRTGIELAWDRLAPHAPTTLVRAAGSPIVLGPMAAEFARHCDKACIVNGITVAGEDHYAAMRAFAPPTGALLSAQGVQTALPHLASGVDVANATLCVNGVDELEQTDARFRPDTDLTRRYRIRHASAGEAQAAMALVALRHDVAQCVSIQLATGLDTHGPEWATVQPRRQLEAFRTLALLVDDLEREGALARTTIVVYSEFGRAARLNARGGRDHGVHASALLIGAGVPHNRVVGATSDAGGLRPLRVDRRSGRPMRRGGLTLTPPRLWASVLASAGVPHRALEVEPLPCLMG